MNKSEEVQGSFLQRWVQRTFAGFCRLPEDKEQLVQLLRVSRKRELLDGDALAMIEGVLQVSELQARDIMIPRAHMIVINRGDPIDVFLPAVIESAHSRFPVIGDDRGEVVGLILAKDLLAYSGKAARKRFNMGDVLRAAVFVPESKRLNVLLKDFRTSRNHMAIVVDEYGEAAGLVTIEDVLEQIVGEIEDEYDFDEDAPILKLSDRDFTAKAHTTIDEFNAFFGTDFSDQAYDTLSGLVTNALGHLPQRGETIDIKQFRFKVQRADGRRIHLLNIRLIPESTGGKD